MRQKIRDKYNNLCLLCLLEGRKTKADTVHHIHMVQDNPTQALDEDNLIPVCTAHHFIVHHPDSWLASEHRELQKEINEYTKLKRRKKK